MPRQVRRPKRIVGEADRASENAEYTRMAAALLACLVRGVEDSADQIQVMDAFGVSSISIGKAMGISPISVRTALHRKRRAKKH